MKSNVFKIVLAIVASLVAVAAVAVALATGTSDGTVASEQRSPTLREALAETLIC